jgi:pimeloyl-ACP methyl ester carboxylesterase
MKLSKIFGIVLIAWLVFAQSCVQFRISDSEAIKEFATHGVTLFAENVVVDGFNMHYTKTGNDTFPTLLFVHGSPGSWNAFTRYMVDSALLTQYRMISVDRPGFGDSEFGNAKNLQEQSDLISPLMQLWKNNKPAYVIGHSLGGPMAVKLAADNPDYFSGIILLAGSVDPAEEKPEKWRPVLYKTPLKFLVPGAFRPSNKELWFLKKDLKLLKEDFTKVNCPVWIIHGDKDNMVPVGNAAYAKQMLTHSAHVETKILPGASHFIPWDHYKDIKEVLMHLN